eukprot:124467_1
MANKKSVTCPVCHKTFRVKKNKTGKIAYIACGHIIQKKRSSSLLKQIIKPKKSKKKQTKPIKTIKRKKIKHRKVKSLRDEIGKAYSNKSYQNPDQSIVKHARTSSSSLIYQRKIKHKQKQLHKNKSNNKVANTLINNGYSIQTHKTDSETIFFHEFMDKKYGLHHNNKSKHIDPITKILANDWEKKARSAKHWSHKFQLLKELKRNICIKGNYKIVYNEDSDRICMYLVKWFVKPIKCFEEIKCRNLILNVLIIFCKTYKLSISHANQFAETLIKKEWNSKTNSLYAKHLATKALIAVYYASECRLIEWKLYLIAAMKLKLVYVWQFLGAICIFGAKDTNTEMKWKALNDLKVFLNENWIIKLIKSVFINGNNNRNYQFIITCSEFVFGIKYLLNDMKMIDCVYSKIKDDIEESEYAQILLSGDNAFDFDKCEMKKLCNECYNNGDLQSLNIKCDKANKELKGLKNIVRLLRVKNQKYSDEIFQLRSDVAAMDKKTKWVDEDIRDIKVEMFNLKQEIFELEKRNKHILQVNNNFKGHILDYRNWNTWNVNEVLQWILCVDNKLFLKYKEELCGRLLMENIRGNELYLVNDSDLIYFGIVNENDRNVLMECIKSLINNEYTDLMVGMSPPPIAFGDFNMDSVMMPVNRVAKCSIEGD